MAEDGNVVVLSVVCVIFGSWILAVFFARKADKNDKQKVGSLCSDPPCVDTVESPVRWSLTGSFTNSNLTDGGTSQDLG